MSAPFFPLLGSFFCQIVKEQQALSSRRRNCYRRKGHKPVIFFKHGYKSAKIYYTSRIQGIGNCSDRVDRMAIPFSIEGCAVIDIGTRDGGLAFEFEKRGAKQVVANDIVNIDHFNFKFARDCMKSSIPYLHYDLYSLPFLKIPNFDIVNCSGVIYHVPDPYLLLMAMRQLCKPDGILVVESAVIDRGYYVINNGEYVDPNTLKENPVSAIDGLCQYTPKGSPNSWIPSIRALASLCNDAGLEVISLEKWGKRAMFTTRLRGPLRFESFYLRAPLNSLLQSIEPHYL